MAVTITICYALAVACVILWVKKQYQNYQFRTFAGQNACLPAADASSRYPFSIDRLLKVIKLAKSHGDFMEELLMPMFYKYGWTLSITTLGSTNILTVEPENIKATLLSKFEHYVVEPDRQNVFRALVGRAIFTVDGAEWKHSRGLFKRQLTRGELTDMKPTEDCVEDLLMVLQRQNTTEQGQQWTSVLDLQPLFQNLTLDLGTEVFFGANVKSQLAAIPGLSAPRNMAMEEATKAATQAAGREWTFSHALEVANDYLTDRSRLQGLARMAKSEERLSAVRYLQAFVGKLVDRHLDEGGINGKSEKGVQHSLVQGLSAELQNPLKIREEALFALVASRDTTSTLLDWTCLMMAKHPDKFEKLRASILETFGTTTDQDITPGMLKRCVYLQWFLNETFRLRPAAPMNSRVAAQDTVLPVGGGPDRKSPIAIRKGTKVTISMYAMHRRVDIWGKDALEFRPERWEDIKHTDWTFLPFSGGPRSCPGKEFAMAEAALVVVRLLQRFDRVESPNDLGKIRQKVTAVLEPMDGVKLRFRVAEN